MDNSVKQFPRLLHEGHGAFGRRVPSKRGAVEFLGGLVSLLFPLREGKRLSPVTCRWRWRRLRRQFRRLIAPMMADASAVAEAEERFFSEVTEIYGGLREDAEHFAECDPAAHCAEEVVLCYPGFYAIMVYRLAHAVYRQGIPILPRLLAEHAHSRTGIDIHPAARIGSRFYIDHGTGVVIGETTIIGNNVTIYQGVTLGATFVKKSLRGVKRHPTIEDGVILYAGCTILGGDTVVGAGSIVGGNVWLTESVAPGTKIFYKPEIKER